MTNISQQDGIAQQQNRVFDRACEAFAANAEMMARLRGSRFYADQIALGRSEFDAICNAVRTTL